MVVVLASAEIAHPSGAWRSRIVGHADVDPRTLVAHPANWRVHTSKQEEALRGLLEDVGYARSLTVSQRSGRIIDGHLRVALAIRTGQPTVAVEYVDLDEHEELELLATLDPLAALAQTDATRLAALLGEVTSTDGAATAFLDELRKQSAQLLRAQRLAVTPAGVEQIAEQFQIIVMLPSEAAQAALLDQLTGEGYTCKALIS